MQPYLDQLGFNLVGYGCTTCIGNSGPLDAGHRGGDRPERSRRRERAVRQSQLRSARAPERQSELPDEPAAGRGVRARGARRHRPLDASRWAAEATAARCILRDIWPTLDGGARLCMQAARPGRPTGACTRDFAEREPAVERDPEPTPATSTRGMRTRPTSRSRPTSRTSPMQPGAVHDVRGARALAIFGDSVTTDHISPAGRDQDDVAGGAVPAGAWRRRSRTSTATARGAAITSHDARHVRQRAHQEPDGAGRRGRRDRAPAERRAAEHLRRGDAVSEGRRAAHRVRGTGVRHRQLARLGREGHAACSACAPSSRRASSASIAATWSAWASCPVNSRKARRAQSLELDGTETFDLLGSSGEIRPRQKLTLVVHRDGRTRGGVPVVLRIDTPIEVDYYRHGGILPYVFRQILARG